MRQPNPKPRYVLHVDSYTSRKSLIDEFYFCGAPAFHALQKQFLWRIRLGAPQKIAYFCGATQLHVPQK
jgi:hypothetical protein